MSDTLRELFFSKVSSRLYDRLREGFMKGMDMTFVYKFSHDLTYERAKEIFSYLETHIVTLENMNEAVDYVVENILMPHVKGMRIL
jgi:hypothetical protein